MKTTFAALATVATLSTATFAPLQANAAIGSLGECYNAVITWCNEAHPNHAQECAGGGMDECDEEFASAIPGMSFDKIKVRPSRGGLKWQLIDTSKRFNAQNDDDYDDDNSRPSRSRSVGR